MEGWQENHFADQKVGHQEGLTVRSMVGRMEPRSVDPMVRLLVGHQEGRMEPRSMDPMVRLLVGHQEGRMEPRSVDPMVGPMVRSMEGRMEPRLVGPMVRSMEPLQEELRVESVAQQVELAARMEPHSVGLKEHW